MKNLLTIILLISSSNLFCQSDDTIVPFFKDGQWGFMNKEKEIIVVPKYEEAYPSFSDRYRVKIKEKYGYINKMGKLIIKPKFEEAEDFRHRIAKVNRKGKVIYINRKGRINKQNIAVCGTHYCIHPKLNKKIEVIQQQEKLGIVHDRMLKENGQTTFVSDTIQPMFDSIFPITHQVMCLVKDSLISFSHQGSYLAGADYIVENLNFEYQEIQQFNCNFCNRGNNEYIGVKKDGLWGYVKIRMEPREHIKPQYFSINSLAEGFALVEYEIGKFGYIDVWGNEYFIR